MKFALLILANVALAWLLRGTLRRRVPPPAPGTTGKPADVQPMVACAHCGVLIPGNEALPGRGAVFCSSAHRDAFGDPPPSP